MEVPLTPLEFARRARRLYADREAVVDGDLRLTYEQFFDRCDRWSAALQRARRRRTGDRVAYIAPNTHAQLESFYAVPQLGAVLVPINYRLTRRRLRVHHRAQRRERRLRARGLPRRRSTASATDMPGVEHFVALEGAARRAGSTTRHALAAAPAEFVRPQHRRERPADHQLHERHDVAAQGRDDHAPQRLHELRRHAGPLSDAPADTLPVDAADVPRQRLDVRVDRDRRGRHARLPAQGRCRARSSS